MSPGVAIERARDAARSPQGRALLDAADQLLALGQLAARVRHAQERYWGFRRKGTDQERRDALAYARHLEGELDAALTRAGLGAQQLLPDGEPGANSPEDLGWSRR